MDVWIAKYLDGDLTEEEAKQLMAELERNPALERELRGHEDLLVAAAGLERDTAPRGLADGVMREISVPSRRRSPERRPTLWPGRIRLAAAAVAAFVLGHLAAQTPPPSIGGGGVPEASAPGGITAADAAGLLGARIVYRSSRADVHRVTVAGSFNGWSIDSTPLTRTDGGLWTVVILLPPGRYEYMFVEDGERWVTDPLASRTIDDGFGGRNSVLDLGA